MQMKHTAFSSKGLSETKAALSLEKSVKTHLAESPPRQRFLRSRYTLKVASRSQKLHCAALI